MSESKSKADKRAPVLADNLPAIAGFILIGTAVALAFLMSPLDAIQKQLVLSLFSLGAGGIASIIPGFLRVKVSLAKKIVISAAGAIAVFVILIFFTPAVLKDSPPPVVDTNSNTTASGGLDLHEIVFNHNYLNSKGDYEAVITYDLTNHTGASVNTLLTDSMGWFGWDIKHEHTFSLDEASTHRYSMKDSAFFPHQRYVSYPNGEPIKLTEFLWQPVISPALSNGQSVRYSVTIKTYGTESEAFENGSFLGMGTPKVCEKITSKAVAPPGYRIRLLDCSLRGASGELLTEAFPRPNISADENSLSWVVRNPRVEANYTAKIKFLRNSNGG